MPRDSGELTPDVEAATGLCAGGSVRIAPSPGKGLGVFAAQHLPARLVVGEYKGEMLTLDECHARYGRQGWIADADTQWHVEWSTARQRRGVGVTGQYVFSVGRCPRTSAHLHIDAEDCACANFTRFLNHSSQSPNLTAAKSVTAEGVPLVRFIVREALQAGQELFFDYGRGYDAWLQRHCQQLVDADWPE